MKKPEKQIRAGSICASIWRDERADNGRAVVRHNVTFQKRYFDQKTKSWQNTDCFFADDLPRHCLVAGRAFEFIALRDSTNMRGEMASEQK
ncbi:MAG: hypothetical protein V1790_08965 [Planctomycetota bacterium]